MTRCRIGWIWGVIGVLATLGSGQENPTLPALPVAPTDEPAKVSLISQHEGLVPGKIALLGIRFQMAPGWHIYWDGRNDSGLPPMFRWTLPEGFEVGPVMWPAPHRHILGDRDLLDHVLEGDVLAIVPIRVREDMRPGERVAIRVRADWLVCQAACLPGKANLSIELPVVAKDAPNPKTRWSHLFRTALEQVPRAWSPESGVRLSWSGRTLELHAKPDSHLEFYPHADSAPLADRFDSAVSETGVLRLTVQDGDRLIGVLRIHPPGGRNEQVLGLNLSIGSLEQAPDTNRLGWLNADGKLNPIDKGGGTP